MKKALVNDYKEYGEPSLVREPPRRNTLKVSDFQALVDSATAKNMASTGDNNVKLTSKKRTTNNRKGGKKSGKR